MCIQTYILYGCNHRGECVGHQSCDSFLEANQKIRDGYPDDHMHVKGKLEYCLWYSAERFRWTTEICQRCMYADASEAFHNMIRGQRNVQQRQEEARGELERRQSEKGGAERGTLNKGSKSPSIGPFHSSAERSMQRKASLSPSTGPVRSMAEMTEDHIGEKQKVPLTTIRMSRTRARTLPNALERMREESHSATMIKGFWDETQQDISKAK